MLCCMRRRDFYWSLFHRNTNNQLNDLRTSQVEAIYAAIPEKDRPQWVIWKEGFKAWKPFTEFPVLLRDLRTTKPSESPQPPPIPKQKIELSEREIEDEIAKELSIKLEKRGYARDENRKTNRFTGIFKVRIKIGENIFETNTRNISMVGMLLAKPLPKWVPKYFTVELISDEGKSPKIDLLCSKLQNGAGENDRIRIESNDNCEILRQWLVNTTY